MAKILVTGGAGYIGSHAVKMLVDSGYDVVVVDNLVNGHQNFVSYDIPFYEVNIGHFEEMENIFNTHDIDAVMHFAGYIEAGLSMIEPEKFFRNNCVNGEVLLEVMRKFNVSNMVFSSTAAVYGEPVHIPIKETDPLLPTNFYGETKLFFEKMLNIYEKAYGFNYVALRYFNAAGAGEDQGIGELHHPETHLIPRVLLTAKGHYPHVSIFGTDYETSDGTCVRDYIHVIDLVEAHILALDYLLNEQKSDVFNLGNGEGYTVKEVIEVAKNVTGVDFSVEEEGRRDGDPAVLVADASKAQRVLGWKQKKSDLEKIIHDAWAWHKNH